jgi:hypothetical protein
MVGVFVVQLRPCCHRCLVRDLMRVNIRPLFINSGEFKLFAQNIQKIDRRFIRARIEERYFCARITAPSPAGLPFQHGATIKSGTRLARLPMIFSGSFAKPMEDRMFRDFLNNFILDPWRLDLTPNLKALVNSPVFWGLMALFVFVGLIYRRVRKK